MKPRLTLYVEESCSSCERAQRVLAASRELQELAEVDVQDLRSYEGELPEGFVGVPTTVLAGRIVALGTPDCSELVRLVRAYTSNSEGAK